VNDYSNYTDQDRSRMKYYLPELEEKLIKYPKSITLKNAIVHIRKILDLPKTIDSIDPVKAIEKEISLHMNGQRLTNGVGKGRSQI
jgi:hypothetical protein